MTFQKLHFPSFPCWFNNYNATIILPDHIRENNWNKQGCNLCFWLYMVQYKWTLLKHKTKRKWLQKGYIKENKLTRVDFWKLAEASKMVMELSKTVIVLCMHKHSALNTCFKPERECTCCYTLSFDNHKGYDMSINPLTHRQTLWNETVNALQCMPHSKQFQVVLQQTGRIVKMSKLCTRTLESLWPGRIMAFR